MGTLSHSVPAREGHDNYPMSLALSAYAAASTPPQLESQVIPPEEEYRPHTGEDWTRVWQCGALRITIARSRGHVRLPNAG